MDPRFVRVTALSVLGLLLSSTPGRAAEISDERLDAAARAVEASVIAWRRDLHQHPELSNREFRTSALVAEHLTRLGLEVRTGIAHTGVAAVLRGGRPGPVVALRADMDALPVKEVVDLPFASQTTAEFNGRTVSVMHACGHDVHTAVLMGVAEALAGMQADLPGTVLFIFQPAEEGAPAGERGGAALMLEEGLFEIARPGAVFALHASAGLATGTLGFRSGAIFASSNSFTLVVRGRQTHGALPWAGVDSITVSAQIVLGLQTIISRQIDLSQAPAVLSIGSIHGGVRQNIVPEQVEMLGTLRTFDAGMRDDIMQRMRRTVDGIAGAAGATAELTFRERGYPVTVNDPALAARMRPVLERVVGPERVREIPLAPVAEDFAYYAQLVPGFYFSLGVTPSGQDPATAPPNHSPRFFVDEEALGVGLRAILHVAVAFLRDAG
jgi:amidohydrolase